MLIDKGYYDYDYEKPTPRTQAAMSAAKSDQELIDALSKMGFGRVDTPKQSKPLTPDEMQRIAMQEARKKKNKGGTE